MTTFKRLTPEEQRAEELRMAMEPHPNLRHMTDEIARMYEVLARRKEAREKPDTVTPPE